MPRVRRAVILVVAVALLVAGGVGGSAAADPIATTRYEPQSWQDLGGVAVSSPAATSSGGGRVDVALLGTDDQVYQQFKVGAHWSGWISLGGVGRSAPALASWGAGRLDVFVRGGDGGLYHRWYDGGWSAWEPLGGLVAGDAIAAVSWAPGRLDVFVRGTDDALWHRFFQGVWSPWESLGGSLTGSPGVSSWGPGRLDVFVPGTGGVIYHRWFERGWSPYETLAEPTFLPTSSDAPVAASTAPGRITVYIRHSLDQLLWSTEYSGGTWSHWNRPSLVGDDAAGPAVTSSRPGVLDLFTINFRTSSLSYAQGFNPAPPRPSFCNPWYVVCLPDPPPMLSCRDFPFRDFAAFSRNLPGSDPHGLDPDGDGIACEST